MHNSLNLSPACTGLFNGDIRANAAYRSQWNSVTVPYSTFSFGYDQSLGNISSTGRRNSAGFVINNDRAGDGKLNTLQMLISYAHLFALGSDSVYFINAGIQTGITYRKIDINNLTFDNQFNGDNFDPSIYPGEFFDYRNIDILERVRRIYPDINAGLSFLAIHDNFLYTTGLSIQHLNKPRQSFMNEKVKLPLHWQCYASASFGINNSISYNPSFIFMQQRKFNEITGGLELKINMKEETARKYAFGAGLHYRLKDAIIPNVALYYNQWRMGLSYDVNTSGLRKASNGRGGPEFNVTYIMKKIKYAVRKNNCPVY